MDPGQPPARLREALHQPGRHRIAPGEEDDGSVHGRMLRRDCDGCGDCVNEVDFLSLEIPRRLLDGLQIAGRPNLQDNVFALFQPQLPESLPKPFDQTLVRTALMTDSHASDVTQSLTRGRARRGE